MFHLLGLVDSGLPLCVTFVFKVGVSGAVFLLELSCLFYLIFSSFLLMIMFRSGRDIASFKRSFAGCFLFVMTFLF